MQLLLKTQQRAEGERGASKDQTWKDVRKRSRKLRHQLRWGLISMRYEIMSSKALLPSIEKQAAVALSHMHDPSDNTVVRRWCSRRFIRTIRYPKQYVTTD